MCIGPRYNMSCYDIVCSNGCALQWVESVRYGGAENAGVENAGAYRRGWKMQEWKIQERQSMESHKKKILSSTRRNMPVVAFMPTCLPNATHKRVVCIGALSEYMYYS